MDHNERIDLYLKDKSGPKPLVRLPSQKLVNTTSATGGAGKYSNTVPPTRPFPSSRSSVGSSSRLDYSESISRRSSSSSASAAPSIHFAPPWHPNPPRNMTRIEYSYHLPCEFAEISGCQVVFDPANFTEWKQHEASHFVNVGPPQRCACIFCDHDNFESWEERMDHIGGHYHANARLDHARPDFFVIEQLYRGDMLTKREFDDFMEYTERTDCGNLVDYDFKTPEMEARERRQRAEPLRRQKYESDVATEDRRARREFKDKGKGRRQRAYKASGSTQIIYQEPRP